MDMIVEIQGIKLEIRNFSWSFTMALDFRGLIYVTHLNCLSIFVEII